MLHLGVSHPPASLCSATSLVTAARGATKGAPYEGANVGTGVLIVTIPSSALPGCHLPLHKGGFLVCSCQRLLLEEKLATKQTDEV